MNIVAVESRQRVFRRQWVNSAIAVLVVIGATGQLSVAAADTPYREALQKYWQKELKEDGFMPLYYASTAYAPKSVWAKTESNMDYYGSGQDLLPESRVPIIKAEISLPGQTATSDQRIGLALQLAGLKAANIDQAKLEVLRGKNLAWDIVVEDAELHYFSKLDARRTMDRVTSAVLKDYLSELYGKESLWMVVKAVYAGSAKINVTGGDNTKFSAEVEAALVEAGFTIDLKKASATKMESSGRYVAVGLRRLTESGLRGIASNKDSDGILLIAPEGIPESIDIEE